jgi:F-type H+-transporting ATPase subunit a
MPHISLQAQKLFAILGFPVTNSFLFALITGVLLIIVALIVRSRLSLVPGRLQSALEIVLEMLFGVMDPLFGSRAKSEKYLPLIATIFLFILIGNWLGLLPGVGSIGLREEISLNGVYHETLMPFFRAPGADLNFTIALAVIAVLSVNILGVAAIGFGKYFSRFFTLRNPALTFAGILEFISEFVKIISFSFRLFGNIFAGEVLLTVIGFLAPFVLPLPFLFLEIFVGFIQALIFALLTLVFISMAVSESAAH